MRAIGDASPPLLSRSGDVEAAVGIHQFVFPGERIAAVQREVRLSQNLRALSEYGEIGAVFYAEFILVSESVVVPDEHPVRFRYLASGKQHQSFAFS